MPRGMVRERSTQKPWLCAYLAQVWAYFLWLKNSSPGLGEAMRKPDRGFFPLSHKKRLSHKEGEGASSRGRQSPSGVPAERFLQQPSPSSTPGNFKAGDPGHVLKKYCSNEQRCLEHLGSDVLQPHIPAYCGTVEHDGEHFVQTEDLLSGFDNPSILDCKMGTWTYLEEELQKTRQQPCLCRDMYDKTVAVDPSAPMPEEHAQHGVLKLHYMQWRESLSSTSTLGFHIEGIKRANGTCSTSFKKTRQPQQVVEAFWDFLDRDKHLLMSYLDQLEEMRAALEQSKFFKVPLFWENLPEVQPCPFIQMAFLARLAQQVVGSSLLFVHDKTGLARVWMIDFGKTLPLPEKQTLTYWLHWVQGNREDSYLWGLENLMAILQSMLGKPGSPLDTSLT